MSNIKNKTKKCLIISGGDYSDKPDIQYDFIIACDRGYEHAIKMGIRPDLVIGDFDSCGDNVSIESRIIRLPAEKDDTDTMSAVKYAINEGYKCIHICCAFGGRLDHTIANIQTAAYIKNAGCEVCISGNEAELYIIKNESIELQRRNNSCISVFSLTEKCSGVYERGLRYSLSDAILTHDFPLGVSNEWEADTGRIEVQNGMMAVLICKKN